MRIRKFAPAVFALMLGCDLPNAAVSGDSRAVGNFEGPPMIEVPMIGVPSPYPVDIVEHGHTSPYSPPFSFRLDTENSNNADELYQWSNVSKTWEPTPTSIGSLSKYTTEGGGVNLGGYQRWSVSLPRMPFDYLLWRLSNTCPENSLPVGVKLDTENDNNQDQIVGIANQWPNSLSGGGSVRMEFCFVSKDGAPANATLMDLGWLGVTSVFADPAAVPSSLPGSVSSVGGMANIDLEDDAPANAFYYYSMPTALRSRVRAILDLDRSYNFRMKTFNWVSTGV